MASFLKEIILMAELFNVYCDESCHLENDGIPVMVLGAIWCRTRVVRVAKRLRAIKRKHGRDGNFEVKWSQVTLLRLALYQEIVNYFFDEEELHFRGVLIPDKGLLDHATHQQSHNEWYYKMCFLLLNPIISPTDIYRIYQDRKDTRIAQSRVALEERLHRTKREQEADFVCRVQHVRSHESELLQVCDLLTGAIGYRNRGLSANPASAS